MAQYTFRLTHTKDIYTLVATGVAEVTFWASVNGRIIVQDTADVDPAENATGWMEVQAWKKYNLAVSGLEVFYRPWSADAVTNGMKK